MPADAEPYFCGWCLRALLDDGGCPTCEWIWTDLMTESEARAFRAGVEAAGTLDTHSMVAAGAAALAHYRRLMGSPP